MSLDFSVLMVFVAQRLQHITVAVHSLTLQYLYLRLEDIVRWHTSVFGSSDDVNMKGSELLIIEITGVKNTLLRCRPTPIPVSACIFSVSFSRPFREVHYCFL